MKDWTQDDAAALRTFISRTPHFIPKLLSLIPRCTGATTEERAATGSEGEGARKIIENIEKVMVQDVDAAPDQPNFISED